MNMQLSVGRFTVTPEDGQLNIKGNNMHHTDGNLAALAIHEKEIDAQYELDSALESYAEDYEAEFKRYGELSYSAYGSDRFMNMSDVFELLDEDETFGDAMTTWYLNQDESSFSIHKRLGDAIATLSNKAAKQTMGVD